MDRLFVVLLALASWAVAGNSIAQRAAVPGTAAEGRIALVIGNASYKDAPLANPLNDARAIARALSDSGFQVKLQTNLTQSQMRRAIREFGDELHAKQGVGLFYFAGHGVQISNRNFLIPVGTDIQREYEVEDQAVDAGAVLSMMQSAKARVNIVILDACRNNPYIRDFRTTINGLAPMQAPAGTLVAFSTAPGQTAIDGAGQFGLYTEHLVENLSISGLKIEDVFKNVRVGVQRASAGRQIPWENTSLTGDFYFRPPAAAAASAPAAGRSAADIDKAVQDALRRRDEEEAARRATQQDDIERAVLAALRKREEELSAAQTARVERDDRAAKVAIESLNRELAELRATRAAEKAQPAASVATQSASATATKPDRGAPAPLALAAPSSRAQPSVKVGGHVERPDVRVGDRWRYQVTEGYTDLRTSVLLEVATVTETRIYTRRAATTLASLNATVDQGVVEVWDRDWSQLRQGDMDYAPVYPWLQFPLEAGKSWSATVTHTPSVSGTIRQQLTVTVGGWEKVTVPAGAFDAVKLTVRGSFAVDNTSPTWRSNGTVEHTIWYAPAVRQIVRKELQQRDFQPNRRNALAERWELVEHHLP